MDTARAHGVHCGRMLAMCWSHRVAECEAMISKGEERKQPTKIVSIDIVMDLARQGYTVNRASAFIGVSRNTLRGALASEGRLEEFQSLSEQARGMCQQGDVSSRVAKPAETVSTRGGCL